MALVWGPLAGYFAQHEKVPLALSAIEPGTLDAGLPYDFAIAMGVRRKDRELRDRIGQAIADIHPEIEAILAEYGIPHEAAGAGGPS